MREFIWTEKLVKDAITLLGMKFSNPNEFADKWEGVEREMEKFKDQHTKMINAKPFEWTDELVADFAFFYRQEQGGVKYWGKDLMQVFKDQHTKVNNANDVIDCYNDTGTTDSKAVREWKKNREVKRSPLGLIPLWLHNEMRLTEVNRAIIRYIQGNEDVPKEWTDERDFLIAYLVQRNL